MVSSCGNDAMLRQVTEAILIKELNPEINIKDEWRDSNALREKDRTRRDDLPNSFKEATIEQFSLRRLPKGNENFEVFF